MTHCCFHSKKLATSRYVFAPRRKGTVSPSTYRPYRLKEKKVVELFCSLVITSRAPDWNPALTTNWSFSLFFSSCCSEGVLKKSCWFGSSLLELSLKIWATPLTPTLKQFFLFCLLLSVAFFEYFSVFNHFSVYFVLFFFYFFPGLNTTSVYLFSLAIQYTVKIAEKSYLQCLPPSVVMSQNTFKELPFFSGSIQYSPSPFESPASKMCLQDRAGWREDQPGTAANLNMFYFLVSWFRVNCQIIWLWRIVVLCFHPFGPSWSRMAVLGQQSNIDMEDVTYAVKRKFLLGIAVLNEMWITTHPCMCFCLCFALFFHSQVQ